MAQQYYGCNGRLLQLNVSANHFLEKITLCLWDKVGIPRPLSKEDAVLIARILRNYVTLQEVYLDDPGQGTHFWSLYGLGQDDEEDIKFTSEIALFFEECNGLTNEGA